MTEDKRDLRDPQEVGIRLRERRLENDSCGGSMSFHSLADLLRHDDLPDYSHNESTVDTTVREYHTYLEEKAAQGDSDALDLLKENGRPVHTPDSRAFLERARERYPDATRSSNHPVPRERFGQGEEFPPAGNNEC